jgi:N-acetylglutamate synthase-like GNAT family acetyltransferase
VIVLREPREADWDAILTAADAAIPFDPAMNREWLRNRKCFEGTGGVRRHYVAVDAGTTVGYGAVEVRATRNRTGRLFVVTAPSLLTTVGTALFDQVLADARALELETVWLREYADDAALLGFLSERDFRETARTRSADGVFEYVLVERRLNPR